MASNQSRAAALHVARSQPRGRPSAPSGDLAWPCLTITGSHVIRGRAFGWQQQCLYNGDFWFLGLKVEAQVVEETRS